MSISSIARTSRGEWCSHVKLLSSTPAWALTVPIGMWATSANIWGTCTLAVCSHYVHIMFTLCSHYVHISHTLMFAFKLCACEVRWEPERWYHLPVCCRRAPGGRRRRGDRPIVVCSDTPLCRWWRFTPRQLWRVHISNRRSKERTGKMLDPRE